MPPPNLQVPELSKPSITRVDQPTKTNHKYRTKKHKTEFHTTAPAHKTRLRTHAAEAPPVIRTRERTQLTKLENKKQTGHASTLDVAMVQLENDVHQALEVMETYNGKLLSYRKLTRNPKF